MYTGERGSKKLKCEGTNKLRNTGRESFGEGGQRLIVDSCVVVGTGEGAVGPAARCHGNVDGCSQSILDTDQPFPYSTTANTKKIFARKLPVTPQGIHHSHAGHYYR